MNINERFETIIKEVYGNNQSSFAKAIGVSPTVIANVVGSRRGKPSFDVLEKVCANAYVSPTWLLTGEGDMLRTSATVPINPIAPTSPTPQFEALISTIAQQAEEIGRLKARIDELERRRGDNVPDAQSGNVAHAG